MTRLPLALCLVLAASAVARAESVAPQSPRSCDAPLAPVSPTGAACELYVAILERDAPAGETATATLNGTPVDVEVAGVSFLEMQVDERVCQEDCSTVLQTSTHFLTGFQIVPLEPLGPGELEVFIDDADPIRFVLEDTESCTSEQFFHVPVTCGNAACEPGLHCMRPDAGPSSSADDAGIGAGSASSGGCRAGADTAPVGTAIAALSVLALLAWRRQRRRALLG